jgi:hypothetical protein
MSIDKPTIACHENDKAPTSGYASRLDYALNCTVCPFWNHRRPVPARIHICVSRTFDIDGHADRKVRQSQERVEYHG